MVQYIHSNVLTFFHSLGRCRCSEGLNAVRVFYEKKQAMTLIFQQFYENPIQGGGNAYPMVCNISEETRITLKGPGRRDLAGSRFDLRSCELKCVGCLTLMELKPVNRNLSYTSIFCT